ncbi:calpastatin isoform X2 [Hemiscyllium ocellatum]|uniref:calpastatin isoform X2 n=1 Tax=Hemiscyllium ocellatum TaxID=170820 RepID=UPI002966354B|nr:calpastatin isoform X2 [Hemiscyllium ocellatum]
MSQPNKRKAKEPKKGAKKQDLSKSPKQGVSMSAQTPEEKPKGGQPTQAEDSKPMSSTRKPSDKLGSGTAHKSADSSKVKSASSHSTKPTTATGGKQQQPQSTMGLGWTKTTPVDTKETSPTKSSMPEASVHKTTEPKLQDKKPTLSAVDQLADTLPSQGPDTSIPKYTGAEVKESSDSKKKAERVGETEESIPPEYRFTEPSDPKDKGKKVPSSTHPETKPKGMSEGDALESLSADFGLGSAAPISKCSAATSHSAAPQSVLKEIPSKASSAASKSDSKGEDPFDLPAGTLPSEAPDDSGPKYTGPEVKESDVNKKKAERVGEREESIPPDYRFKEQPDLKGKDKAASFSTGPGVKPEKKGKGPTDDDVLESLSADFDLSSSAPVSKCSAATSHSAVPLSMQKQTPLQASTAASVSASKNEVKAPLKASTAATVSAGKSDAKDEDPLDVLAETLPSEAPDNSAPKYTGPEVKESDADKKKAERVGETEESIPPDYRFKDQPDSKDKAKGVPSSTGPGARPKVTEKSMAESDVIKSLSADFAQTPPAPISKCSAASSHSAPPLPSQQAPLKAASAASVSASKSSAKDKDPVDLLAGMLPSEAPDNSAPKYTGPAVKESDADKKKAERVGETEESIPPDYRFKEQPDPKDKGKVTSSSTGPGAKSKKTEKKMTESDVLDSLSADFVQSSPAPVSKCSAPVSQSAPPPTSLKQAPLKASTAATVSAAKSDAKGEDPFGLLAGTLPSEAPDDSGPKYTGPEVKEADAKKKKAERVGETEESIPPDYRFKEQPDPKDKGKVASSSAGPGAKPPKETDKRMTDDDVLESLSTDFVRSSPAPISKCSALPSHSAAPLSVQKEASSKSSKAGPVSPSETGTQAPLKASTAAPVSASQTGTKTPLKASTAVPVSASQPGTKDEDAFDVLAGTLPSEALDNSAPKYTGPEVKESDAKKKKAERVGETEESIPPDYRFKEQPDHKDKGKGSSSSAGPGAKPKESEKCATEGDALDSLSADFGLSSQAPISKCSAATSHSAVLPDVPKEVPLKASTAASVSASQGDTKGEDPFDLLAETLPSEAPDNSAPKYTGPEVKEADVTKKKAERVGETEGSIPPDYRFKEQPDPKDKGKIASSSTGPGTKPKSMSEDDVLESLSADFVQSSPATISKCSAPTSHCAAPPPSLKQAPVKASKAAPVSASQGGTKGEDPFGMLAETLPSEAPDNSGPKYTGPAVKESDHSKKKPELVGETEESIPPDYRFIEQPDPKNKGKQATSSGPGAKPKATEKLPSEAELIECMASEFDSSTSPSGAPLSKQKEAGHNTKSVSKTASAPKTSDVGPKSPKTKTQPSAKTARKP